MPENGALRVLLVILISRSEIFASNCFTTALWANICSLRVPLTSSSKLLLASKSLAAIASALKATSSNCSREMAPSLYKDSRRERLIRPNWVCFSRFNTAACAAAMLSFLGPASNSSNLALAWAFSARSRRR